MSEVLMVFVNCEGREQAEGIANRVVEERLAACVNVVGGVRSCYVWEGKTTWSEEVMLMMKTTRAGYAGLEKRIKELHSYEVPEVMGLNVEVGEEKYLQW